MPPSRSSIPPISAARKAEAILADTLKGAEDGELFVEKRQSESLVCDDGKLSSASFDESQGFGLRAVQRRDCRLCPCHRPLDLRPEARRRGLPHGGGAAAACVHAVAPERTNRKLYADTNPLAGHGLRRKDRAAAEGRCLCPRPRSAGEAGLGVDGGGLAGGRDPARPTARATATCARWCASTSRSSPPTARNRARAATASAAAASRCPISPTTLAGGGARGAAPEPRVARGAARAGGRDGRAAGPRLARHPAA